MSSAVSSSPATVCFAYWDLVRPREHGSWSLAFEPIVLGLLCAPSVAGGWLALAVAAGFFCRRPLRTVFRDYRSHRRHGAVWALAACALVGLLACVGVVINAGVSWMPWLLPALALGGLFARYDLRNDGRDAAAEIIGAAAFASLPAVVAVLGGWPAGEAFALGVVMCARSIPTVMFIRATIRGRKNGDTDWSATAFGATMSVLAVVALWVAGFVPFFVALAVTGFFFRMPIIACFQDVRARTLGMIEAVAGVLFILLVAVAWRL
jgi:hypothetical protein